MNQDEQKNKQSPLPEQNEKENLPKSDKLQSLKEYYSQNKESIDKIE